MLKLGFPEGCLLITACTSFTFTDEDNFLVAVNGVLEGPERLAPDEGVAIVGPDVAAAFRGWPSTTNDLTSQDTSTGSSNELPLASGKYALLPLSARSHTVEGSSYKRVKEKGRYHIRFQWTQNIASYCPMAKLVRIKVVNLQSAIASYKVTQNSI